MGYTLISMIGTGMYKEGYRRTTYQFQDGKQYSTSWFLQALLESGYRDIVEVRLVGTYTSNWDALLENIPEAGDLWIELRERNENKEGIPSEALPLVEKYLSDYYKIPFTLIIHTDKIDETTTQEVFSTYYSLLNNLPADNDILFDITHGFRSMPMLMYQNLHLRFSSDSQHKIEFVYGEYLKDKDISYVRDYSDYWKFAQLSDAVYSFENRLDGTLLSELIKNDWPKGSKAIKELTDIVNANFVLQFDEVQRQIKNAMVSFPENSSPWLDEAKAILEDKILKINDATLPARLFKYSQLLFDMGLYIQAVISLQVTVEAALVLAYGNESFLGEYDWISDIGKKELNDLKKQYKELQKLQNLEYFRNQIAHGGGKSRLGGFPRVANTPAIYESGKGAVEKLLSILKTK